MQTPNESRIARRNRAGVGSAMVAWSAGRMAWPPNPKRMTPKLVPSVENVTAGGGVRGSCGASVAQSTMMTTTRIAVAMIAMSAVPQTWLGLSSISGVSAAVQTRL